MPSAYTVPGLEEAEAAKVREALQDRLLALIDLTLTLKHIHWNVVGPAFIGVHEMLDPQHAAVQGMVDVLAERIATLGGTPQGTPGHVVAARTWDDYSLGRATTIEHLGALDLAYVGVITDHRQAEGKIADLDPVTDDILVGQIADLEQFHWFVRAHLEQVSGKLSTVGTHTGQEAAEAAEAAAVAG